MNRFRETVLHVLATAYGSLPVNVFRNMMNCAAHPEPGENPEAVLKLPPRSDGAWAAHFAAYEAATRCISDNEAPDDDVRPLVSKAMLDEIRVLSELPADELGVRWRKQHFSPGAVAAAFAICQTAA